MATPIEMEMLSAAEEEGGRQSHQSCVDIVATHSPAGSSKFSSRQRAAGSLTRPASPNENVGRSSPSPPSSSSSSSSLSSCSTSTTPSHPPTLPPPPPLLLTSPPPSPLLKDRLSSYSARPMEADEEVCRPLVEQSSLSNAKRSAALSGGDYTSRLFINETAANGDADTAIPAGPSEPLVEMNNRY